jgi:hypothetical protein
MRTILNTYAWGTLGFFKIRFIMMNMLGGGDYKMGREPETPYYIPPWSFNSDFDKQTR